MTYAQILRGPELCQVFLFAHREDSVITQYCLDLLALTLAPLPRLCGTLCKCLSIISTKTLRRAGRPAA